MSLNSYKQSYKRAFGVFENKADLEAALGQLRKANYPMEQVSVVKQDGDKIRTDLGKDSRLNNRIDEPVDNQADKGASTGAVVGGTLGGITGLLVGLGTLAIPGVGPILLAGATATALATALAGGAIGAATGGLLGGLVGLNIPEDRAKVYQDRVYGGDFLVIIEGSKTEIDIAEDILKDHGIQEWEVYDISDQEPSKNPAIAEETTRTARVVNDERPTLLQREEGVINRTPSTVTTQPASVMDKEAIADRIIVVDGNLNDTTNHTHTSDSVNDNTPTAVGYGTPGYPPTENNLGLVNHDIPTAVGYGTPGYPHTEDSRVNVNPNETISGVNNLTSKPYGTPVVNHDKINDDNYVYRAVSVYSNSQDLRVALDKLHEANFPREQISVVSKHTDDVTDKTARGQSVIKGNSDKVSSTKADEGAATGAATGGALGGLGGLLVGLGILALPGVGPIIAGGTLATALATAAAGGAIGATAGGLTGALVGLGIPENDAKQYNDRLIGGDYLLVLEGSESQLREVRSLIKNDNNWQMYKTSDRQMLTDSRR